MRTVFNPESVNQLSSLIFDLEEELTFDGPLTFTTRAAVARRVMDLAAAGETDPLKIKACILNRSPVLQQARQIGYASTDSLVRDDGK